MKNLESLGYEHYAITREGKIFSIRSGRFLNTQSSDGGYETVTLQKGKKTRTLKIHRLVALMYIDNSENKPQVNHKDGIKTNNHVSNLEWCTRSENMLHAYDFNLIKTKPRTVSEEDAHRVCKMLEEGGRPSDVSSTTGIELTIIHNILNRKSYKYISYEYDFMKVPRRQKLSEEKILWVCHLLSEGIKVREISTETKVHESTIKAIKQRRVHRHLADAFEW